MVEGDGPRGLGQREDGGGAVLHDAEAQGEDAEGGAFEGDGVGGDRVVGGLGGGEGEEKEEGEEDEGGVGEDGRSEAVGFHAGFVFRWEEVFSS